MRKAHWNAYTAGLARDAKARWAAAGGDEPEPDDARGDSPLLISETPQASNLTESARV